MDNEQARLELDRLIRTNGTSYAAMSRLLRRNAAYVQQYIKRGRPDRLDDRDRRLLADFFGVDEQLLEGGAPPAGQSAALVMVPKLDVQASAGPGATLDGEATLAHYGFDRRWLKELSRGKPEDLSIVRVRGDSMAPTLVDGDDILVDRVDGSTRLRDGIYVLQRDDALLVKRLALSPATGKLTIASDNPAYPSWNDCDVNDVRILGRVVWTGRRLG
jgi:phage repressor protein C with HTH and peptisase S24 domain